MSPVVLVIVRAAPETCNPLVTVMPAEPVAVRLPDRMVEPDVVNITGLANEDAAAILILPL